jgi:hypothetical protein
VFGFFGKQRVLRNSYCYRYALFGAVLLMPSIAHAHAMFGSAAPFWSGVLHFFVTPLALAAAIGLMAVLAGSTERVIFWAVSSAALATFFAADFLVAAGLPISLQIAVPVAVAAVGLFAVTGANPTLWPACVIAVIGGVAAGIASGADARDWGGSLGAALVMLVLISWGATALVRLQTSRKLAAIIPIARRVLGAWIAAIALLAAALSLLSINS